MAKGGTQQADRITTGAATLRIALLRKESRANPQNENKLNLPLRQTVCLAYAHKSQLGQGKKRREGGGVVKGGRGSPNANWGDSLGLQDDSTI